MIQKVQSIVLHQIRYGETSLIVNIYTNLDGRQAIMVKGVRGAKKNKKAGLFHPLAILDTEMYYKISREIQQVKEVKPLIPLHGITSNPVKNAVALFLAEVLYRSLRESEANPELYSYLSHSIQYFDLLDSGSHTFHLYFLIHLTRFLGFFPTRNHTEDSDWFDLRSGSFCSFSPNHDTCLAPEQANVFSKLMELKREDLSEISIPRNLRNLLIEKILDYYHFHLEGLGEIRSFSILKTVFS